MKKFFLLTISILAFVTILTAESPRKYKIATIEWIAWSPLDVAAELGFWKEEGVDVELIHYETSPVLYEVIRSGKVDLSCNMAGSIVGMHNTGTPMTILAEIDWSHGGDLLIQKKGFDITEYEQRVIGIHYDSPAIWIFIQKYLERFDMDFTDFRRIELDPKELALQFLAGRLPFIQNYEPFASIAISDGEGEIIATSADFEGIIPDCLYGLRSRVNEIPPEDLRAIIRGWVRAAEWSNNPNNWDAYSEILKSKTLQNTGDHSDEALRKFYNIVRIHNIEELRSHNLNDDGIRGYLSALFQFMDDFDKLDHWKEPFELLDTSHLIRALDEMDKIPTESSD